MDHDNGDWKRDFDKFKIVQKCPRCNQLALKYAKGRIECLNCGFEQNVGEI